MDLQPRNRSVLFGRGLERIDRCSIDESVAVKQVHSGLDLD